MTCYGVWIIQQIADKRTLLHNLQYCFFCWACIKFLLVYTLCEYMVAEGLCVQQKFLKVEIRKQ